MESSSSSSSSSSASRATVHVVLALAHLLRQRSPSYDAAKDALLDASVRRALASASASTGAGSDGGGAEGGSGGGTDVGAERGAERGADGEGGESGREAGGGRGREEVRREVHVFLTGSPRPTFAETNAWLLEGQRHRSSGRSGSVDLASSPRRAEGAESEAGKGGEKGGARPAESLRGSYSILDNSVEVMSEGEGSDDDDGDVTMEDVIGDAAGGSGATERDERDRSPPQDRRKVNTDKIAGDNGGGAEAAVQGPMAGRAVVDAVSVRRGVGLRSSRAKLLQGTIDRPLWDQRRWTDGECLFSELVDRCGLESFEGGGGGGGGG
ncbi:hypothetical protein ACHAWF_000977, partial [Thalassiosira exigua]